MGTPGGETKFENSLSSKPSGSIEDHGVNSIPVLGDKTMARKQKQRSRAQQVKEADEIYTSLVLQRTLVRDLIHDSAKDISDPSEAADVHLDLYRIVRNLAVAVGPGSPEAIWQNYKHHFVSDRKRDEFFTKLRQQARRVGSVVLGSTRRRERKTNLARLRRLAKRLPSARLRKIRIAAGKPKDTSDPSFQWDSSLLPKSIAPSVLRVATLHPGVLERFLPRFFFRASDCLGQKSTYRRAILILDAVPEFGWSAEKHTRMLIEHGAIESSEAGSEVETIKKFIRDLRRRHKKRLALTRHA
jgi:hypothetical protein